MRVLVVGGSGQVGVRVVAQLVERGHEVIGTVRSPDHAGGISGLGARAVTLDLLDAPAARATVLDLKPDAIVHEATSLKSLGGMNDFKNFDRSFALTNRLRAEGTDTLLAAARDAGVTRIVAQSFAGHRNERSGGPVKTEDDPPDPAPLPAMRETVSAMAHLDDAVTRAGGAALRYGAFYGEPDDAFARAVRNRRVPIVGDGAGVWSFIHLDDAATATVLAVEQGATGVFNIVDDEPARVSEWLPVLADALGAKPPMHVPRWLTRIVGGETPVMLMTESRGASNAKAKRELGWTLRYPSWRQGFFATYRGVAAAA